jgi:hypothetical protein
VQATSKIVSMHGHTIVIPLALCNTEDNVRNCLGKDSISKFQCWNRPNFKRETSIDEACLDKLMFVET